MGWLNDTINGKEKKIKADPLAKDINAAGVKGLGILNDGADKLSNIYSQDPTQLVNTQIGMENKVARTAADDALRRTRSLIAQRGIGNSSIGIGQQVNQAKQMNDQVAMNNASGISRLRDMQIDNAQGLVNTGNGLYGLKANQGIQMTDQKYRAGGYGQLIAAGAQMYAGSGGGGK